MGFLDKIIKPVAIGAGTIALGSILFPQTTAAATGGLFGNAAGTGLLSGGSVAGATAAKSIWDDPTVLSSGILAGTSLLSNLFGSSAEEDAAALSRAELDEKKRQFDASLELEKAQLAQALEIAKIHAGGSSQGAGIAAAAQRAIAKANAIGQAAALKGQALQIPLQAKEKQTEAAQTTGAQSGAFFNNLIPNLQRPALRGG